MLDSITNAVKTRVDTAKNLILKERSISLDAYNNDGPKLSPGLKRRATISNFARRENQKINALEMDLTTSIRKVRRASVHHHKLKDM